MPAGETKLLCAEHVGRFGCSSEDANTESSEDSKGWVRKFQSGIWTPLAFGLEAMCVMFWQKICLHFAHILRLCWRLKLKVLD